MNKIFVVFGALSIVAASPSLAQDAAKALPKCGGAVQDSCDQSTTTERYALTAAQAEKSGGVGDRHVGRMGGMAMGGKSMSKHHAMKHHAMKHRAMKHRSMKATTATTTDAAATPKM